MLARAIARFQMAREEHCECCEVPGDPIQRVYWLQGVTICWMLLECGVSLWAALQARSLALFVFGADSLVELLSAAVVLLQFVPRFAISKHVAERTSAVLLYLLAAAVICIGFVSWNSPRETSFLGLAITAAALIAMPVLAWLKRKQALKLKNRALAADATQSATCAYLAGVTLAGLAGFAIWHIGWIDTIAALAAVPIVILEGLRTWQGEGCC